MVEIVLYQPEIPPNTGNVARTCAITKTKLHLIKPLGFDIDDKAVKRAGLDYWHLLDLEVHDSIDSFLERYENKNIYLATTKASRYHSDVDLSEDCMIIFGKETAGLPEFLHQKYLDNRIKLPMLAVEAARSLNLSNAVNIILYEAMRQQDYSQLQLG